MNNAKKVFACLGGVTLPWLPVYLYDVWEFRRANRMPMFLIGEKVKAINDLHVENADPVLLEVTMRDILDFPHASATFNINNMATFEVLQMPMKKLKSRALSNMQLMVVTCARYVPAFAMLYDRVEGYLLPDNIRLGLYVREAPILARQYFANRGDVTNWMKANLETHGSLLTIGMVTPLIVSCVKAVMKRM